MTPEPQPMERSKGDWALAHASRGWRVFPLRPNSKKPRKEGWPENASADPARIRTHWARYPDDNIGVACGEGSNPFVIDFDNADATDAFEAGWGLIPTTLWSETPHGHHAWFLWRVGLGCTVGRLGFGIDTRGEGGFVVAPGSSIDGQAYAWLTDEDQEIAEAPTCLTPALAKVSAMNVPSRPRAIPSHVDVEKILDDRCYAIREARNGTRNVTLNDAALMLGHYVGAGRISRERVEDGLLESARAVGLPDSEAMATMTSGLDAGVRQPRDVTVDSNSPSRRRRMMEMSEAASIQWANTIAPEAPELLWGNRLVPGAVNLLAGDGGVGKSTLAQVIAGAWTNGVRLPDDREQVARGKALFVCYEDAEGFVRIRGDALGLDPSRYAIVQGAKDLQGNPIPFGTDDLPTIRAYIDADPDIGLLVIDPWAEFLADNLNDENRVRRALAPLTSLARDTGVTAVVLAHTNKNTDATSAKDRIAGNKGLTNCVRSALFVGAADPDARNVVSVAHVKSNYGPEALTLTYEWRELPDGRGWFTGDSPFAWREGTTTTSGDDLIRAKPRSKLQMARDWLRSTLGSDAIPARDVEALAADEGITPTTLRRAREEIVETYQKDGSHWWKLR
jgi:hypothetical protein